MASASSWWPVFPGRDAKVHWLFHRNTAQSTVHQRGPEGPRHAGTGSNYAFGGQKLARIGHWDSADQVARSATVFFEGNSEDTWHPAQHVSTWDPLTEFENVSRLNQVIPREQWIKYGLHVQLNTPGQADGFLRMYIDEELVGQKESIRMRTDNRGWNWFWIGGNNSWSSGITGHTAVPRSGNRYLDDIRVYDAKP